VSPAAAAMLLETADNVAAGRHCLSIDGYAMGNDAQTITAPSSTPEVLTKLILQAAGGRPFDFIHAHGTGTQLHDPIELAAIDAALSQLGISVLVYSHKGALGHTLGASGLVAVVLNCLAHGRGVVPGNIRTIRPLQSRHAEIRISPVERPIARSIALAAGFGGPAAAVTLRVAHRSGPQ
jgi:3-oxoacyl-(acyl-carrier-protein) synthase